MAGRHPGQGICQEEVYQSSCDDSHKLWTGSISDLEKNQRLLQSLQEMNSHHLKRHAKDCIEKQRDEDQKKLP